VFDEPALIEQKRSSADQRQNQLSLTLAGRAIFAGLDGRSRDSIGSMLEKLPEHGQCWLVAAMERIRQLLAPQPAPQPAYRLRSHRPGDMG
jgi:DNA-binding MarR family transcriptional regulator